MGHGPSVGRCRPHPSRGRAAHPHDGGDGAAAPREPKEQPCSPVAPDARTHVAALRASHDHLVALVEGLDEEALRAPSYDTEWSVGQVLSHLGSQSEIFELVLEAVLEGRPAPGGEVFPPVWDVWNAKTPVQWRDDWRVASERHVARFEAIDEAEAAAFQLDFFGTELDLTGFVRMRLSEQAVHTWDIEVMGDPTATVAPEAVSS